MTMSHPPSDDAMSSASAAAHENWLVSMDRICEESGYFEPLGKHHWAFFVDEGPTLLVTFETLDSIRTNSPEHLPMGCKIARRKGWSHLCIIADGETWYRDPTVYRYFDRLVDDAFFEDFDHVVFYGAGMGGYAACAYSVTAPGATVLAVQPRATLDPAVAGWDQRHMDKRRLNFTDRYGYAPDMIEGTGDVFVVFDPNQREDAMHAALLTKPFVTKLRAPNVGANLEVALTNMQVLHDLIDAACEGKLTAKLFANLMRKRRNYGPYLKTILAINEAANLPRRIAMICRSVTARLNAPRFRRTLAEVEAKIGADTDTKAS